MKRFLGKINQMYSIQSKLKNFTTKAFSPKYLLLTNISISISLSAVGDIIEQKYEIYSGDLELMDGERTKNMAISGMTVGVLCHYWYKFLDARMPGRTIKTVFKKVVIDQLICSPFCIASLFLTLGYLEKSNFNDIKKEIKHKAMKLYVAEWVVWPPAQIINFYILPNRYRVLYDNTISLGYDIYTSQIKHKKI